MDLEEDNFLDMDTAVPLGIIVNKLLKFPQAYIYRRRRRENPDQALHGRKEL
jgi:hypothetical protein